VQADMQIYHPLATRDAIEVNILKMRDDFASLRRGVKQWAMAVVILLLVLCGTVFWMMRDQHLATSTVQMQGREVARAVEHSTTELHGITTEMARIRLTDGGKGFGNLPLARQMELNRTVKAIEVDDLLQRSRKIEFPAQLGVKSQQLQTIVDDFRKQRFTDWPTTKAAFEKSSGQFINCIALEAQTISTHIFPGQFVAHHHSEKSTICSRLMQIAL